MHIAPRRLVRTGFGLAMVILGLVSVGSYQAVSALIESTRLRLARARIRGSRRAAHRGGDRGGKHLPRLCAFRRRRFSEVRRRGGGARQAHSEPCAGVHQGRPQPCEVDRRTRAADRAEIGFPPGGRQGTPRSRLRRRDAAVRDRRGPRAHAAASGRLPMAMEQEERRLLARRTADVHRYARRALAGSLAGTLLSVAILICIYFYLEREIRRRRRSEARLIHLNRLYAVLTHVSQAIVRISGREELLEAVCRITVEEGRLPHGLGGSARSPVAMRAPHGAVRPRRRLPRQPAHLPGRAAAGGPGADRDVPPGGSPLRFERH